MISEADNIELRSEKIKNIIGQVPSKLVRYGITIISLVLLFLVAGSYFFTFHEVINTSATLIQKNDTTIIRILIPAGEIDKIKNGQKVIVRFNKLQNEELFLNIQDIPNQIYFIKNEAFYMVQLIKKGKLKTKDGKELLFKNIKTTEIKIITAEISVFDRICHGVI